MAVNDTARSARKDLNDKARQTYVVKKTRFNRNLKLHPASNRTLTATLHTKGRPLPLSYFQVRKGREPAAGKGHQLQSTSLSPIVKNGNKAFVQTVRSKKQKEEGSKGHRGLFYRLGRARFPIVQVYGSSVPVMIGGKRVYGEMADSIQDTLYKKLDHHIEGVLRRM